ncbi:MAG: hypothetical protein AAF362_04855 [Pseudomonadota bacterium]
MSLMDFCLWVAILTFPGIFLAKLFFYLSAGWQDLLTRVIVSHLFAAICIANLCVMVAEKDALQRTAVMVTAYMMVQLALLVVDMARLRLTNVLGRRLTAYRMMVWPRSTDRTGVEPAE